MGAKSMLKWSKQITPAQVVQLIRAEKDVNKALVIFDSATAEYANGFKHDEATFGLMISRLVSANHFKQAEDLLDRMKKESCNIKENVLLSICRGYGRVHRPVDAIRVFHRMKEFECEPTEKSYVTVFDILVEETHKFQEAANFLDEMVLQGISPNRLTWSLHARIHNTVVQGLCKSDANRAFQVYLSMRTRGISIEAGTYGFLITCFCKKGDLHKAARIVDEMVLDGCVPDEGTWSVVVSGFWDRQKVRQAAQVELINKFVEHEEDIRNQDA
ncbi:hypothetical protein Pint_10511 [Pistacia integerrima]|uniref:Uncharacterized protein n=1 Tax=Pistacia integerrima TaxID=434235 RepID=A0ACC0XMY2_9ROSI|nr:hypothetical protein Pint_10511 [Pistacia integerrima]